MTIEFSYEGDVSHLDKGEREQLRADLQKCTRARNWDYLDITRKQLSIGGSYDDENGDVDDYMDIESVLNDYDVDWSGGAEEVEYEPDWDSMPGGYDTLFF